MSLHSSLTKLNSQIVGVKRSGGFLVLCVDVLFPDDRLLGGCSIEVGTGVVAKSITEVASKSFSVTGSPKGLMWSM